MIAFDDYDEWEGFLLGMSDQRRATLPKLPLDWTAHPLKTMPQIKCYRCRQFLQPGAKYYDAGEVLIHQACGDMLAPPREPDTSGPS